MRRLKPKLRSLLLAFVAVVALAGFALLLLTKGKPASLPPLPNPNGYDDIVKAGSLVGGDASGVRELPLEELRALITTNAEALQLLRVGLSRTCAVPLEAALSTNTFILELGTTKQLALLLAVEGRLAELEYRPGDAARSYVDAIHLGNETSRGGFLIHHLIGISCEAIGYRGLVKVVPELNSQQSRSLSAELDKVDNQAVTWNEVLHGENVFVRHELRQTLNPIRRLVGWWQNRQILKRNEAKHNLMVARRRLLTTELALCCYQSEQGHAPDRLEQLIPKFLQRAPSDPFNGQPLIYRAQGTDWLLYSVGPDGVDDRGKPVGRTLPATSATGDLFFDSP